MEQKLDYSIEVFYGNGAELIFQKVLGSEIRDRDLHIIYEEVETGERRAAIINLNKVAGVSFSADDMFEETESEEEEDDSMGPEPGTTGDEED